MAVSESVLRPRNGQTLCAGLIARISGCVGQKELSLDDQIDHNKEVVRELYDGEVEYRVISTKGKGERLDRPELAEIEAEIRKSRFDLIVFEDLGRLIRGTDAVRLLGLAVDRQIRVIAPNDNIDTAIDTWEQDAAKACADHIAHNAHASRRIKHKNRNRFLKFGGAMARPIAGYIVPDSATTYADWQKDSAANEWIRDGYQLLRQTLNYSATADMLNGRMVPPGPYCKLSRWNCAMVKRFFRNPLLKGMPYRNKMHSVKHYESGQRRSVKDPNGPVYFNAPHLAFLTSEEFDELGVLLDAKNANFRRKTVGGEDPLLGVPRRRSKFPGRVLRCFYCGYSYVWGGNGVANKLMCNSSRTWNCWNTIGVPGGQIAENIRDAICQELYKLEEFDDQYRELVERAGRDDDLGFDEQMRRLKSRESELDNAEMNLLGVVEKNGYTEIAQARHEEIKQARSTTKAEILRLRDLKATERLLPKSTGELRELLERSILGLSLESFEFGDNLRRICPELFVYLVRMCDDDSRMFPRVQAHLRLDGLFGDHAAPSELTSFLHKDLVFDVFAPPQRERIRLQAVKWREQGLGVTAMSRMFAEHTGERPTPTAVGEALRLHSDMERQGLTSPFIFLPAPVDTEKRRRFKNPKYDFRPLEGYTPPQLL